MTRRDDWVRIDVQMPREHHERIVAAAERETTPLAVWIRLQLQHAANGTLGYEGSPTRMAAVARRAKRRRKG